MQVENDVRDEVLNLSTEILNDIELDKLPFDKILYKGLRLARLKNDFKTISWLNYELQGYSDESDNSPEKFNALTKSGRYTHTIDKNGKSTTSYYIKSIPELETQIESTKQIVNCMKLPTSIGGDKILIAIQKIEDKLNSSRKFITDNVNVINRVKSNFYNYVTKIYYETKFQNYTHSLFTNLKNEVDNKLNKINPDIIKQFVAVYDRLSVDNEVEWSQAMSTCRNIIKCFADEVYPASNEKYKCKNGKELDIKDNHYKNRLIAYVDSKIDGDKKILLESRFSDLQNRIQKIHDILSNGTHNSSLKFNDVQMCVIQTYFLLADLINL